MNKDDLDMIMQTMRTLSEGLQTLAQAVEAMPKTFASRLENFKGEINARFEAAQRGFDDNRVTLLGELGALTKKVDAFGPQFAEHREGMQVEVKALEDRLGKVIADNRVEIDKVNAAGEQAVIEILGKEITTLRDSVAGEIKELQDAAGRAEETLQRHAQEFRAVSEQANAAAQRAITPEQVEEIVGGKLAEAKTELSARMDEGIQHAAEEVSSLGRAVREEFATAVNGVNDNVRGLRDSMAKFNEETVQRVTGLAVDLSNRIEGVEKSISESLGQAIATTLESADRHSAQRVAELAEKLAEAADEAAKTTAQSIGGVAARLGDFEKNVGERFAAIGETFTSLEETVAEVPGTMKTAIASAIDSLRTEIEKTVGETGGKLLRGIKEVDEREAAHNSAMVKEVAEFRESVVQDLTGVTEASQRAVELVSQHAITFDGKLNGLTETVTQQLDTQARAIAQHAETSQRSIDDAAKRTAEELQQSVRTAITGAEENLGKLVAEARNETKNVREHFTELLQGQHETFAGIGKSVAQLRADFESLVPGITDEQMASLEVKLAAMVEGLPAPTVEPPRVELSYNDGELVVDINGAIARIPVNVGVSYRGVYAKDEQYKAGDMVTHDGSLWACVGEPTNAPGKDYMGWRLAVKRGADAKTPRAIRAYDGHEDGRVYYNADFLRVNNRLWQCAVDKTQSPPESSDITSTAEWLLIGQVH